MALGADDAEAAGGQNLLLFAFDLGADAGADSGAGAGAGARRNTQ